MGQEVGNREGETQGLDRRYHKVLNVNDERKVFSFLLFFSVFGEHSIFSAAESS